ncbi:MAG: KpsF/GutQ family sugar-phosphate isomerase [Bdellovibrionales bacterium]|nr:KpsF/GutQ family sugar-phosphate isomerase [Bdellovibrionales bacterium]
MPKSSEILSEGQRVLSVEAEALRGAVDRLGDGFVRAVEGIHEALRDGGKIVVTGVGKSGIVARKVAATLTSTGSPAVFLHPTEALHGDLGIVRPKDALLVFSHSGGSEELIGLLAAAKPLCSGAWGVFGNPEGALSRQCDAVISSAVPAEACPHNLAPTASSTLAMAIGDAVAMALQKLAGFGPDHFARFHPGGTLGKRLRTTVGDLMHGEGETGMLSPDAVIDDVVLALTKYRQSGICIVEGKAASGRPRLTGVITEGDIRRALSRKEKFFQLRAADVMTRKPATVAPDTKAVDALAMMENRESQIGFLPVVDESGGCLGVIRLHDLVQAGLV